MRRRLNACLRRCGRHLLLGALLATLGGCAGSTVPPPSQFATMPVAARSGPPGKLFLLTHGWHTDVAVPASEISGPLTLFRRRFPGARTIIFGYGKRNYMTEATHGVGDWIGGPFPGDGAIEVSALKTSLAAAYGARHIIPIDLPPGGAQRLSAYIWANFALDKTGDKAGRPIEVGHGDFPGSIVFLAASTYDLSHTCNTWSAQVLAAAGLAVQPAGIMFSNQIDGVARQLAVQQRAARNPGS